MPETWNASRDRFEAARRIELLFDSAVKRHTLTQREGRRNHPIQPRYDAVAPDRLGVLRATTLQGGVPLRVW